MYSCHLVALLLVFLFQSVRGNQNAATAAATFDKNYSDRLTENNNQQSSLKHNNKAYHATLASGSMRFIASATDPSFDSQASHETSTYVNALATEIIMKLNKLFFSFAICIVLMVFAFFFCLKNH